MAVPGRVRQPDDNVVVRFEWHDIVVACQAFPMTRREDLGRCPFELGHAEWHVWMLAYLRSSQNAEVRKAIAVARASARDFGLVEPDWITPPMLPIDLEELLEDQADDDRPF